MSAIVHTPSAIHPVRVFRTATFQLTETLYPPDTVTGRHEHAVTSLVFCIDGNLDERYAAETESLQRGSMLVLPSEAEHSDRVGRSGCRCVFVSLRLDVAERFGPISPVLRHPALTANPDIIGLGIAARRELWRDDAFRPLAAEGLAWQLLAMLARDPPPRAGSIPVWLARARERIHDSVIHELSLEELATDAGVHPAVLARSFTQTYGLSPGQYLRQTRVESAAKQLAGTNLPLAQIGAEAGFYDQSHFTHAFKSATGLTPGAYRRAHQDSRRK
ncbi:MAG: AraC family transcriptional regulator [Gemmatimonadota bacterium]